MSFMGTSKRNQPRPASGRDIAAGAALLLAAVATVWAAAVALPPLQLPANSLYLSCKVALFSIALLLIRAGLRRLWPHRF